jgi:hypothetical protein
MTDFSRVTALQAAEVDGEPVSKHGGSDVVASHKGNLGRSVTQVQTLASHMLP